jgi:hypothetical protein
VKYQKKLKMQKTWMILPVITLAGFFLSCNIINPAEDFPSIIKIDTVLVKVTNFEQGSASHNMTCIKINVAGATLGIFEMPIMAPCLTTGPQTLFLEPVYEVNGVSGQREVYPFFKPYIGTGKFNLAPGEIVTVVPTTTYKDECKFVWIEDFEDAGVTFVYPSYSDTVFQMQSDTVREGHFSGAVYLDKSHRFFEAYSSNDYILPKTGSKVLLEFDYKSNTLLEFGVYILADGSAAWSDLVYLRPSKVWKRIYLDLGTTAGNNQAAEAFRPGFRAAWDSTGIATQGILMDNLKLIHF